MFPKFLFLFTQLEWWTNDGDFQNTSYHIYTYVIAGSLQLLNAAQSVIVQWPFVLRIESQFWRNL